MKHKLLALGIIGLAIIAFSNIPAGAQTTSAGPYYATPSWGQKLQCDTPATCPRFIVLSNWDNAAVLDRETGLVLRLVETIGGVTTRDAGVIELAPDASLPESTFDFRFPDGTTLIF